MAKATRKKSKIRKTSKKIVKKKAWSAKKTTRAKKKVNAKKRTFAKRNAISQTGAVINNPYYRDLKMMEKKLKMAWTRLNNDARNNADLSVIDRDNRELLILLGECNYLANEFSQASHA